MWHIPILALLLAPGALAPQSTESTPGAAAASGGTPTLRGDYKVSQRVRIDAPYKGVRVTRLWDAFNNCVFQDGTELTDYYSDQGLDVSVTTKGTDSCSYELSRMHWKLEFLPVGSVSGFAEIGIEQVANPPSLQYYNFCNVRGSGTVPKIVCRTGRQASPSTIVIGIDRSPSLVKTTLRVDYQGRASGIKVTPMYSEDQDCFLRDATQIEQTRSSSVDLKATLRGGDNDCWKTGGIGWRVESVRAEATQEYAVITVFGPQQRLATTTCRTFDRRWGPGPVAGRDIQCQSGTPLESGINLIMLE